MNLQSYLLKKQIDASQAPVYRSLCTRCHNPNFSCYCQTIETFDPLVTFVILIHPIEFFRRIATGRMSHLILKNSLLICGHDFSQDEKVNHIITDSNNQCFVLYPGKESLNLTELSVENRSEIISKNKKTVVFVIDGTWATSRQMMRQSRNLHQLPKICFTPTHLSQFRVRKQPKSFCLSTIEAIHQFLDVSATTIGLDMNARPHDALIFAFNTMVERQIKFVNTQAQDWSRRSKPRKKVQIIAS